MKMMQEVCCQCRIYDTVDTAIRIGIYYIENKHSYYYYEKAISQCIACTGMGLATCLAIHEISWFAKNVAEKKGKQHFFRKPRGA